MSDDVFNFGESGILWSADREKYHALGYRLYLSGPRMETALGPEFVTPFCCLKCCLGLLINKAGDVMITTIPTHDSVPFGYYDLIGDHWRSPIMSDYAFVRLDKQATPIRLHCWEGPADVLSLAPPIEEV